MKKIIIAMAAMAAAFTMASCNKELAGQGGNATAGKSVITAHIENDLAKTFLEGDDTKGYEVFWSEGDKLFVSDSYFEEWAAEYTLDNASAGSRNGSFGWLPGDFFMNINEESPREGPAFVAGNMYIALYPSDIVDMDTGAYIWKTEQTCSGTAMYIPMVGTAECTEDGAADFMFANLGGLLRLTVKGTATVKSITVLANEPMSGEIAAVIDDDEGNMVALMLDETDDGAFDTNKYITLDCGDGVGLSSEGADFYISMPCHYAIEGTHMVLCGYTGVTITLTDTEGRTCVKKLKDDNQLVIERSHITTASFMASEFNDNIPTSNLHPTS